jgi:hypothetical protein
MGLGRKVWVANDILAAADVNGYLMDQSVMYFASSTARDNAIGTPVAGMVASIAGTALDMYSGSAWVGVYPYTGTVQGSAVQFGGTVTSASMTATSALENGTISVSGTAAVTITIPDVLQTWDTITVWRNEGGTVTIAAGTGITDWAGAGTAGTAVTFKIDQTYNAATVQKVAANTYRVVGRITA